MARSVSPNMEPVLLTVPQVAAALQIARGRAYELVNSGAIPSVRLGRSVRVPRNALLNWIESKTQGQGVQVETVE